MMNASFESKNNGEKRIKKFELLPGNDVFSSMKVIR